MSRIVRAFLIPTTPSWHGLGFSDPALRGTTRSGRGVRMGDQLPVDIHERLLAILLEADIPDCVPDASARSRWCAVAGRFLRVHEYALVELKANLGVDRPAGCLVDFHPTGLLDGQGCPCFTLEILPERACKLRENRMVSRAIMGIMKKWEKRLDDAESAGVKRQKLAASDDPSPPPPLPPPQVAPARGELERLDARGDPLQSIAELPPHANVAAQPADAAPVKAAPNHGAKPLPAPSFELRFRWEAATGLKWGDANEQTVTAVRELEAKWKKEPPPRELNRLCTQLNLPPLNFTTPKPHHVLVYEVEVDPFEPESYRALVRRRAGQTSTSAACPRPSRLADATVLSPQRPSPDGNSHAHRVFTKEKAGSLLLRVRLAPVAREHSYDETYSELREKRVEHLLRDGLSVAGRRYAHLAHKDAEKEKTRQLWFITVASSLPCERDGMPPSERSATKVKHYRDYLLDSAAPGLTVSKLAARMGLAFSPAVPLCMLECSRARFNTKWTLEDLRSPDAPPDAFRLVPPNPLAITVVLVNDVYGTAADGTAARDSAGKKRLMTDGAGLISPDLARLIPPVTSGRLRRDEPSSGPLLTQIRLWFNGLVAKGMLLLDATLPPGVCVLRDSMVKVTPRAEYAGERRTINKAKKDDLCKQAFEVLRTSNEPGQGRLTPQLVPLLGHGGGEEDEKMVELLLALQDEGNASVLELRDESGSADERRFKRLLRELGCRPSVEGTAASPADMLLAGFDATREPFLQQKVAAVVRGALEDLARGKVAVPGSLTLIGTPDPSSTIPAGCVVLVHKGSYVEDDALIYRSPRRFESPSATWAAAACVSSHPIPVPTLSQMAARNHLRRRIARRAQGRRPACVRCAAERGARQDAPRGGDGDGERRHFLGARRALARRHVLWRRL